jgi:hypothetical protein
MNIELTDLEAAAIERALRLAIERYLDREILASELGLAEPDEALIDARLLTMGLADRFAEKLIKAGHKRVPGWA